MVVVVGTGSVGSVDGSDFVACTTAEVCTKVDTDFGIDWVGTTQADMMLALVHPKLSHHYSSSRCQPYFPSRASMLCNPSLHGLLTYKFTKKSCWGTYNLLQL